MATAPFEILGPVETGPPAQWQHLGEKGGASLLVALCGHVCERRLSEPGLLAGYRYCPDCIRIAREKGYKV